MFYCFRRKGSAAYPKTAIRSPDLAPPPPWTTLTPLPDAAPALAIDSPNAELLA